MIFFLNWIFFCFALFLIDIILYLWNGKSYKKFFWKVHFRQKFFYGINPGKKCIQWQSTKIDDNCYVPHMHMTLCVMWVKKNLRVIPYQIEFVQRSFFSSYMYFLIYIIDFLTTAFMSQFILPTQSIQYLSLTVVHWSLRLHVSYHQAN